MFKLTGISRVMALTVALPALLCAKMAAAAIEYSITDLGTLGGNYSAATGMNNMGQVVGDSYTSSGAEHAFQYSNGQMTDLGTLQAPYTGGSQATGINDAGQVIGGSIDTATGTAQGFIYSNGFMTDLSGATGAIIIPSVINNSGTIGGWVPLQGAGTDSFVYNSGIRLDIGDFGYQSSTVVAINNRGVAVVENNNGPFTDIILYQNGAATDLGDFSAFGIISAYVEGVNNSGQMSIIGNLGGRQESYLYSSGSLIDLGSLGHSNANQPGTLAARVDSNGDVVGQSSIQGIGFHAFLYQDGVITDLNSLIDPSAGWELTDAVAINDAGQIAGSGYNPSGQIDAFLLTPLPEPGRLVLPLLLASTLLGRRRKSC